MYLGYQNNKIKFYTEQPLDKNFYNLDEIIETQDEYVLNGEEYVLNDEKYQEQKEKEEREKINQLYLTGADVERGIYQAKGMDFDDVISLVQQLQPEGLDIKALKIELKANHFYRGNKYIDAIGGILGFTSEQLDEFFKTNDYTILLPAECPTMPDVFPEDTIINIPEPTMPETSIDDEI